VLLYSLGIFPCKLLVLLATLQRRLVLLVYVRQCNSKRTLTMRAQLEQITVEFTV
jgi:hypothetical protein